MMRVIAQPAFTSQNPYTQNLYQQLKQIDQVDVEEFSPLRLLWGRYDIWHRHWPDRSLNHPERWRVLVKLLATVLCTLVAKLKGIKLVWTVHNLQSHEAYYPRLEKAFWRFFIRTLDGYLCLSSSSQMMAQEKFKRLRSLPGRVVYHPHYQANYPNNVTQTEARDHLGIGSDRTVILLFGQLREYKNIPAFIHLFKQVSDPNCLLLIAGKPCSTALEQEIRQAAVDARIQLYLSHIPDKEVQYFMNAANLVVTPYQEMLNSGVLLLALSFHRPFLTPALGSATELAEQVGSSWAFIYDPPLQLLALEKAIVASQVPRDPPHAPLKSFEPRTIAQQTLLAYRAVCQLS